MIGDIDFIEKYLLETILHEQEIHQLLNEKKLETQEVQSNTIQASNVNSVIMENTCSEKENNNSDIAFNNHKALDASLVVIESSGTDSEVHDESSWSGNDTDVDDADIRPIYDEEPMAEVQFTTECNVFAIGKQHVEKPEIINEGRVDQDVVQCQVKSPLLDPSLDNKTTEFSNQSLESENICLKQTVAQFQKDFLRMEAHCVALKLKYQNQALKSEQHGQILNETSNKAKIKKKIDAFETINIELKHSVTTLLKENKTLKKHNKELYDSIKTTRAKTIEQTTSLIA
ncbi:hypothetical protein Tco_0299533 [Tanacetum coccineum]